MPFVKAGIRSKFLTRIHHKGAKEPGRSAAHAIARSRQVRMQMSEIRSLGSGDCDPGTGHSRPTAAWLALRAGDEGRMQGRRSLRRVKRAASMFNPSEAAQVRPKPKVPDRAGSRSAQAIHNLCTRVASDTVDTRADETAQTGYLAKTTLRIARCSSQTKYTPGASARTSFAPGFRSSTLRPPMSSRLPA